MPAKKPRRNKVLTEEQKKILDDLQSSEITTIDLSGYGAACETLSFDSLTTADTITLSGSTLSTIDTSSISTITLPSVSYTGSGGVNYGNTTISGSNCYPTWTTTGTGTYSYNTGIGISPSTVHINTDGIEIKEGGDIKVDGKSLKDFMTKMEQRLAILVPDPAKLEKFEALKKAYEHYKTMESLCFDEPKDEENK